MTQNNPENIAPVIKEEHTSVPVEESIIEVDETTVDHRQEALSDHESELDPSGVSTHHSEKDSLKTELDGQYELPLDLSNDETEDSEEIGEDDEDLDSSYSDDSEYDLPEDEDLEKDSEKDSEEVKESSVRDSRFDREEYLNDDEEMYKGDDNEIFQEKSRAGFLQLENSIVWSVDGFVKEDGKVKTSKEMRLDPPVLKIQSIDPESNDENHATFLMTKDFSQSLSRVTEEVYRAYYGLGEKKKNTFWKMSFDDKMKTILGWISSNPLQTIGLFIMLIALVILFIF